MRIGITLGAGGARGLAQICFLEVLNEFGIKPAIISGTSIGAIIGAVYASGLSTKEIYDAIDELIFSKSNKFWEIHKRYDIIKAASFIDPVLKKGGLIKGEKFINFLGDQLKINNFSELKIPLKVLASDFSSNKEKVFTKGNLLQAIQASYAVPGLFSPVKIKNKYYIDGGVSNPLPYDHIQKGCDFSIAIDVSSKSNQRFTEIPAAYEILFAGFSMQQRSIINEKLKFNKPDIYVDTNIKDVRIHEFNKAKLIFKQVKPLQEKFRVKLGLLLNEQEHGKIA